MTIQQLQYVLEVKNSGSITRAAKNLFVTQSSVSCAIAALEKELGMPIFQRSWQGVIPTEDGRRVLEHARSICEHHRMMQGREERTDNMVRIETGQYYPLSQVFTKLSEEQRGSGTALCHCTNRTQRPALERLARGETDLVVTMKHSIRTRPSKVIVEQKNLVRTVRKEIPAVIRIGPGHRLYHKEELVPEDLSGDVMIDTPDALMVKFGLLRPFLDIDPERVVLESDRSARYDMVRRGVGFMVGGKFPELLDRQYGFRNIYLDGLYYNLVSVVNGNLPVRPEVERYLELLDEELSTV